MVTVTRLTTEQLFEMPNDGNRYELIAGELRVMSPAGFEHGSIGAEIASRLREFAKKHGLGVVCQSDAGFKVSTNPDTVLAPDAAFVSSSRIPRGRLTRTFFEGPPDLAVEVLSPNDRRNDVADKTKLWLDSGVRLLWIVDPDRATVTIHRPDGSVSTLGEADELDGADVLPGFRCAVKDIFQIN